jgi:N-methylhydantoinase B
VLKSALDPAQALNHGSFRPVTVVAPKGTIVNVTHPAPAGSHGEIRKRVIATMLGALSQACPELISADIHRTSFHNLIGGVDPATGREYVHYE